MADLLSFFNADPWRALERELKTWRIAGATPRFWWRDDDARQPSPQLDRLLALSSRVKAPVALAVIPDADLAPLARRLRGAPLVFPVQHGCDHIDRSGSGEANSEFPLDAEPDAIAEVIDARWRVLSQLANATPIYVPPWNTITPNLLAALPMTAFAAVSGYGIEPTAGSTPPRVNVHLDVLAWGPARFRGTRMLVERLVKVLSLHRRRGACDEPIGLLTHHKNLDEDAWDFLDTIFERLGPSRQGVAWLSALELIRPLARL